MRSDYVNNDTMSAVLWALTPVNRLVCEVALCTGWRIDDILALKTEQVQRAYTMKKPCITITEAKTNKKSRKYISVEMCAALLQQSGRLYVFEGRDTWKKHRSRQAVYMDLKKAAKFFKLKGNLCPHSLRKNYAVYMRKKYGINRVGRELNHNNELVTMLYAYADELQSLKE